MDKIPLTAEIVVTTDRPETWLVEAIDEKSGDVYSAWFTGPNAYERALGHAEATFISAEVI